MPSLYSLLAKKAVEEYIENKRVIAPLPNLPKDFLKRKAGIFITIEKNTNLRGCIGTYLPTRKNIAEEIIYNAIAAATEDYRFGPLQKEELPYLSYTVYILSEPELVKKIDELDPKKYGVIIKTVPLSKKGDLISNSHLIAKTGLLLPDLETVDTVEKQILIACQKGGINPLKEKVFIYRFAVEKFQ